MHINFAVEITPFHLITDINNLIVKLSVTLFQISIIIVYQKCPFNSEIKMWGIYGTSREDENIVKIQSTIGSQLGNNKQVKQGK